jgi:ribonuclease P protein component
VVIVAGSQSEKSHAGIITSKAIGNAVERNRARRRIRSVMAGHLINFIQPHDIVIIARKPIVEATYKDIEQAIREELHKAGLLS